MKREHFGLNFELEYKHWWFVGRRGILHSLIKQVVPPSPNAVIVDIGCGTGANIASLGEYYRCIGIDPSPDAIEMAESRHSSVSFIQGGAPEDLGNLAQQGDLFILSDVLEHVPDDYLLLSKVLTLAKAGAYILLTVPAKRSLWSPHDESHGHYRRYEKLHLEKLWRGLPVSELLVSYFNSRLYPIVRCIRMVNRFTGRAMGRNDTDLQMPSLLVNQLLTTIFQGEGKVLRHVLAGNRKCGYRQGVSLLALLRREEGSMCPRTRPADVVPDIYDPNTKQRLESCLGA